MGAGFVPILPQVLDMTFPWIALVTGRYFNHVISTSLKDESRERGQETRMEDLWLPCFVLSTDVSEMKEEVHTYGCLWRYVRASMSLQGFLPPMIDPITKHLLLDGGYCNNLPVDVMRRVFAPARIIGVDVEAKDPKDFTDYGDTCSGWCVPRPPQWRPAKCPFTSDTVVRWSCISPLFLFGTFLHTVLTLYCMALSIGARCSDG
jgi:lysophospholipid hydrolase